MWRTVSLTDPDWQLVEPTQRGTGGEGGLSFPVPEGEETGFYRVGVSVPGAGE